MASVDEVSSAVSAAVSKSDETDAAIGAAASSADELTSTLQAAGVDDRASMSEEAKSKLDEAAAQQAAAKQSLEAALGILNGIKGLASRVPNATIPPNRPSPLNAAPARLREPVAKIGDPVKPGPVAANPYRQELSAPGDSDVKSKAGRAFRQMGRSAGDIQDVVKSSVDTGVDISKALEKAFGSPGPTTASTKTAGEPAVTAHQPPMGTVGDFTSSVVLAAVSVGVGIQAVVGRARTKRGKAK